jgi:hypothetical protein
LSGGRTGALALAKFLVTPQSAVGVFKAARQPKYMIFNILLVANGIANFLIDWKQRYFFAELLRQALR